MSQKSFGHYEVLDKLGEGGMGVVYKARDTRLGRTVALKFVKAQYSERFAREARAVAALNHPNICTLYDVGEHEGAPYLAMEFVAGKPVKKLPFEKVREYGMQIASAVAAAHAAGIVHRDLKPGNIFMTEKGAVKVLDFGLAKQTFQGGSSDESPTETLAGTISGTAAYMSPEQAEGQPVDARTDIFSFGAVLYEIATGRRAFGGESAMKTLAAVIKDEPPAIEGVPRDLERIIRRCLRKNPEERYQHMGDVRIALEEMEQARPVAPVKRSRAWIWGAAACGVILGILLAARLMKQPPEKVRFTPFATEAAAETYPEWSPDGRSIAYLMPVDGVQQVFLRSLGGTAPVQVTKASAEVRAIHWSADGSHIYFESDQKLWAAGIAGGESRLLLEGSYRTTPSADGQRVAYLKGILGGRQLWIGSLAGGVVQAGKQVQLPPGYIEVTALSYSRDGTKLAAILDRQSGGGDSELWLFDSEGGRPRRVLGGVSSGFYMRTNWMPDNRHMVMDWRGKDQSSLLLEVDTETGARRQLTDSLGSEEGASVSPDGRRIAFVSGRPDGDLVEIALDTLAARPVLATGRSEQFADWDPSGKTYVYVSDALGARSLATRSAGEDWSRTVTTGEGEWPAETYGVQETRLSPEGRRVAYTIMAADHAIWISPLAGGKGVRLDMENTDHHAPSWSPDGNEIAYRRMMRSKWELVRRPVGGGAAVPLGDTSEGGYERGGETEWTPDGEWICHLGRNGLELVSRDGKRRRLLTRTRDPRFSVTKDGSTLLVARKEVPRGWVLMEIDMATGAEKRVRSLPIAADTALIGFRIHPDGKRLLATVVTARQDIWIMEGFRAPASGWWAWLPWED